MKVIDNFISEADHKKIKDTMMGNTFPWFITPVLNETKDSLGGEEFSHVFYQNYSWNSAYSDLVLPIIEKLNPISILRIRAALIPINSFIDREDWHVDLDVDCTTAVYYVNSNNGYTKFLNGEKIESIENRFLYFNSKSSHTGSFCTDQNFRCLINFNYL